MRMEMCSILTRFTGDVKVEVRLVCICGASTGGLHLRPVGGVAVVPLASVKAGDETTRVGCTDGQRIRVAAQF